jgi:hypothetical protein
MSDFNKVREYVAELGLVIQKEDEQEQMLVVEDEPQGIKSLMIDCEEPIVVLEQLIIALPELKLKTLERLLQINRELVHGAFVLNEDSTQVLFRDTLQLENLDLNELKGSINALSLGLAEHAGELIAFAKGGD